MEFEGVWRQLEGLCGEFEALRIELAGLRIEFEVLGAELEGLGRKPEALERIFQAFCRSAKEVGAELEVLPSRRRPPTPPSRSGPHGPRRPG